MAPQSKKELSWKQYLVILIYEQQWRFFFSTLALRWPIKRSKAHRRLLLHILQSASQPANSPPTSCGPSWKEVFSANLFPSCLALNGAIHQNGPKLLGIAAIAHVYTHMPAYLPRSTHRNPPAHTLMKRSYYFGSIHLYGRVFYCKVKHRKQKWNLLYSLLSAFIQGKWSCIIISLEQKRTTSFHLMDAIFGLSWLQLRIKRSLVWVVLHRNNK